MQPDLHEQRVGDKVRVKSGDYNGRRGIITAVTHYHLEVTVDDTTSVCVGSDEITNFSLAARKAWQTMPKRAGRPKSQTAKKMVSIRIDVQLWERLGHAVEQDLLPSREEAVNQWLRERLDSLMNS